jgi:hypothetical protein
MMCIGETFQMVQTIQTFQTKRQLAKLSKMVAQERPPNAEISEV